MNIPKIIHQIWSDKTRSMPSIFQQLAQTWRDCHPGWEYHLWTDVEMSVFVAKYFSQYLDKLREVLCTTGRWMLMELYLLLKDKSIIHLIEAKYVLPYHGDEVRRIAEGEESEDLERKLQDAYAIHYFTGRWMIKFIN